MIKLSKGPQPASLAANAVAWRDELLGHLRAATPVPAALASRYNQEDVKFALEAETHGKCMYCESKIAHVTYAHIEHYKPKRSGMFPELTFEWTNLGLACPRCNNNKSDKFDVTAPFVNPYVDTPSTYFRAEGPFIRPVPGNARAELTELELALNRPELIERRQERLTNIWRLIRCYNVEVNNTLKAALLAQIKDEILEETEYSFFAATHAQLFIPLNVN
jgi:5-methylcytosine-specific restriction endonuclease McrA